MTPSWSRKTGSSCGAAPAFNYRYDTPTELALLNRLWPLVNLRKILFLPTRKAVGYRLTATGRHTRDYDAPRTAADRVKDTGIMLPPERHAMAATYAATDLARLTKEVNDIQRELIRLAALKTWS